MALSGDLKDFGLLQLLTLIQVTGKSGALTLRRQDETAILYFENGQLTRVKTPRSSNESLPASLLRAGRIDRRQFEMANSQPPSEKGAALLLMDADIMSQEEVIEFVRQQSVSDMYGLLTWTQGNFRLDVGAAPPEDEILAPTDLAPIIEKGRGHLDEWEKLVDQIPDLDRPLRLSPEPRFRVQEVTLGLQEWRLVTSMAGDVKLAEIAKRLGVDEFGVRRIAYRLIDLGLAEVVQPEPEPEPAPAPEPQIWAPVQAAPTVPIEAAVPEEEPEQQKRGLFGRMFGRK